MNAKAATSSARSTPGRIRMLHLLSEPIPTQMSIQALDFP
jgi:hypothetical protein